MNITKKKVGERKKGWRESMPGRERGKRGRLKAKGEDIAFPSLNTCQSDTLPCPFLLLSFGSWVLKFDRRRLENWIPPCVFVWWQFTCLGLKKNFKGRPDFFQGTTLAVLGQSKNVLLLGFGWRGHRMKHVAAEAAVTLADVDAHLEF